MRIICAPDSYKESLTSVEAALAMADGVRQVAPDATIDCCPVGDGGEGTLAALQASAELRMVTTEVSGPFGEDINAEFGIFQGGKRAFIEAAKCIGLQLVPPDRRDPTRTTSFGVGELILQAVEAGAQEIIVGIGGSATNDGGCGMAQALGYRFFDTQDRLISEPLNGALLASVGHVDAKYRSEVLQEVTVVAVSDVSNPLTGVDGAAAIYAPQKGASAEQVTQLDDGLAHLATIIHRDLQVDMKNIAGAGAAGGLGGGLAAFAAAKIESGIRFVLSAVEFDERVRDCELCITGEGCLDQQSISGKACIGVAESASELGVPTIALVGSAGDGAGACLEHGLQSYTIIGEGLTKTESMRRARELISAAAATAVRNIS